MTEHQGMQQGSTEITREVILSKNGKCPICRNKILINEGEKQLLKGRISIVEKGKLKTKCKACSSIVTIPLEMLKALQIPVEIPVKLGDRKYRISVTG